jgi:hypothetical protein
VCRCDHPAPPGGRSGAGPPSALRPWVCAAEQSLLRQAGLSRPGNHPVATCRGPCDMQQFAYLEHNPVMWASGFAVLTFRNGVLLPPELVEVIDGEAFFRSCKIA